MTRISVPFAAALAAALLMGGGAIAQDVSDIGQIADTITPQMGAGAGFLTALAFLLGALMGFTGLITLSRNDSRSGGRPWLLGFILIFCGSTMIALPAAIGSGAVTIFGSNPDLIDGGSPQGYINFD